MTGYLPREITPRLARALRRLPVAVLSGLRQSGKSTLLQHEPSFARGHVYHTLDDFGTRNWPPGAPDRCSSSAPSPATPSSTR